jgi:hypothetical protein
VGAKFVGFVAPQCGWPEAYVINLIVHLGKHAGGLTALFHSLNFTKEGDLTKHVSRQTVLVHVPNDAVP